MPDKLSISFTGEAYETFQKLAQELRGFGVSVTTLDGEVIEGVFVGPVFDDEWGDMIAIHPVENDQYLVLEAYTGTPRHVRVGDVHVH